MKKGKFQPQERRQAKGRSEEKVFNGEIKKRGGRIT